METDFFQVKKILFLGNRNIRSFRLKVRNVILFCCWFACVLDWFQWLEQYLALRRVDWHCIPQAEYWCHSHEDFLVNKWGFGQYDCRSSKPSGPCEVNSPLLFTPRAHEWYLSQCLFSWFHPCNFFGRAYRCFQFRKGPLMCENLSLVGPSLSLSGVLSTSSSCLHKISIHSHTPPQQEA